MRPPGANHGSASEEKFVSVFDHNQTSPLRRKGFAMTATMTNRLMTLPTARWQIRGGSRVKSFLTTPDESRP